MDQYLDLIENHILPAEEELAGLKKRAVLSPDEELRIYRLEEMLSDLDTERRDMDRAADQERQLEEQRKAQLRERASIKHQVREWCLAADELIEEFEIPEEHQPAVFSALLKACGTSAVLQASIKKKPHWRPVVLLPGSKAREQG
jgi:hypothetical protein